MVLSEIRKALEGSGIRIFVDCNINDGYDAYKALAMGADAVSVGRGILPGLLKNGSSAVCEKIRKMNEELAKNTGNDVEKVAADTERDNYMTAQQALDYGIIDEIIAPRR